MSLFESGHSTGDVSLAALLNGEAQPGIASALTVPDLMSRIAIGGWPDLLDSDESEVHRALSTKRRSSCSSSPAA